MIRALLDWWRGLRPPESVPPREREKGPLEEAATYLDALAPVDGETRAVYRCKECGALQGRRYIPYGLGSGVATDPCWCVAAGDAEQELVMKAED